MAQARFGINVGTLTTKLLYFLKIRHSKKLALKFLGICLALQFLCIPAIALDRSYPVVDGMTLRMGDVVQRVRVRAKSFGPGGCGVSFTLSGTDAGRFIAPPLTWSLWTEIGSGYLGRSNPKLGFDANCDTGALAEVKYAINVASALLGAWNGSCDWTYESTNTYPAAFTIFDANGVFNATYHSVNATETAPIVVDDSSLKIAIQLYGNAYSGQVDSGLTKFQIKTDQLPVLCRFHR